MAEVDAKGLPLGTIVHAADDSDLPIEIADGVFMSEDVSNSYAIKTRDGAVVINTGTIRGGPRHRARYARAGVSPVRYVILTQHHTDHRGGLIPFLDDKPTIVAERRFPDGFAYNNFLNPFYQPRGERIWRVVLGDNLPEHPRFSVNPDILVHDDHAFELGGRRFELFSTPGGETLDSLCVWLPDDKIVFTGNLFGPAFMTMPNVNTIRCDKPRSVLEYVRNADRVARLGAELLVTGHGEPIRGADRIAADVGKLRDAVQYVHDRTVEGMNAGKTVEQLMGEVRLPAALQVHEWYGTVPWTVKTVWTEYTGWFDQDFTTRLYDVPLTSLYPEIVELAGADVLAARARAHIEAGRPLEGLHLVEMLLVARPGQAEGLKLKAASLRVLLDRAGEKKNLQETVWLRSEIAATEKAIAAH
jgi:alkyl sulfatase BDS1-like metallo-beta-lactamase superfamily hydrolase